jgi:uncharacterized protein (DUF697 family)
MNLLEKLKNTLGRQYFDIEARTDLSDDAKVAHIIKLSAAACAGLACQPIPFADYFILTPMQAFMGSRIAAIRGVPVTDASIAELIHEVLGAAGMGLVAQQLVIGAYKTFIPFWGAFTTVPLVGGATFAMGQVMDAHFIKKARGERMDPEQLAQLWKQARSQYAAPDTKA